MTSSIGLKDWTGPRSARGFTGYLNTPGSGNSGPIGTLLHCVTNSRIPCNVQEFDKYGKTPILATVIDFMKVGWGYAPWKKLVKGGSKSVGKGSAKVLHEDVEWSQHDLDRSLQTVKFYSFHKEKQDKGERDDQTFSTLSVGQTIIFRIMNFMYEARKNEDTDVFPKGLDYIPEFSVIEIMINSSNMDQATGGYGMSISKIRPCSDLSLYSFLNQPSLFKLHSTYEAQKDFCVTKSKDSASIRNMLEVNNVAFVSQATVGAYITEGESGWFKLVGPTTDSGRLPAVPSASHIDIKTSDLLHFTNAGNDIDYARFIVDLAASSGSLWMYVNYSDYYTKNDATRSLFRGVPVIDTEKLLSCITVTSETSSCDAFPLPFQMESLEKPYFAVSVDPEGRAGIKPTCEDLVLCSEDVETERSYHVKVCDHHEEDIMRFYFRAKSGVSVPNDCRRMDYRACKRQACA